MDKRVIIQKKEGFWIMGGLAVENIIKNIKSYSLIYENASDNIKDVYDGLIKRNISILSINEQLNLFSKIRREITITKESNQSYLCLLDEYNLFLNSLLEDIGYDINEKHIIDYSDDNIDKKVIITDKNCCQK